MNEGGLSSFITNEYKHNKREINKQAPNIKNKLFPASA